MALSTFDIDVENISALSDQPNDIEGLSAAELKSLFDKAGSDIKTFLNETLIPELTDAIAAAARGVAFEGLQGEYIADGTVTANKLSSTDGAEAVTTNVIRAYAVTFGKLSQALQDLLDGHTSSITQLGNQMLTKADISSLSDVATSGSYNDLSNKPTIPVIDSSVVVGSTNGLQSAIIQQLVNAKANTNHASTATSYGLGSSSTYGHLKLSAATNATSGVNDGVAATPSAVKAAYDLANARQPAKKTVTVTYSSGATSRTISATGVTASNTIVVSPAPASYAQWVDNRMRVTAQGSGTITVAADTSPTANVSINVLIFD